VVDVVAGRGAVEVLVVGFAVAELEVVVVAAALGSVAYAAQMRDEEKLWCCIRYAMGAARDVEAKIKAETPLRACIAAILN
jgi:hypothetical protein